MNRKVNVWEIAELIESYQDLKNLKDWNSSLSDLNTALMNGKSSSTKSLSIVATLKQSIAAVRIELICTLDDEFSSQSNADIDNVSFKLESLKTNLKSSVAFLKDVSWPQRYVDKLADYVYNNYKCSLSPIPQQSQASTSSSVSNTSSTGSKLKRKPQPSSGLWSEFDIESNINLLCDGTPTTDGLGIPQSIVLKGAKHTHTLTASEGDGPFTVLVKIYNTADIVDKARDDWWKGMVTNMLFTMSPDDTEYETLAELTTQVTEKLKKNDNLKVEKKRKYK